VFRGYGAIIGKGGSVSADLFARDSAVGHVLFLFAKNKPIYGNITISNYYEHDNNHAINLRRCRSKTGGGYIKRHRSLIEAIKTFFLSGYGVLWGEEHSRTDTNKDGMISIHELQFLKTAFGVNATDAKWNYCIVDKKIEGCENTQPFDPDADLAKAKKCCRSKTTDPLDFIKYSDADWNNDGRVSVHDLGPLKRNFGLDCGPTAKKDVLRGVSEGMRGMARLDYNEDGVIDFKDEELMELGKDRCWELETKETCLVCDDDASPTSYTDCLP